MPYILKRHNYGYRVCKEDEPDTCFSKKPLSKSKAEKQKKAIIINEGGSKPKDMELYNEVKRDIYKKIPKHSAYRSMALVKEYKKRGGTYEGDKPKDTGLPKWIKEDWREVNSALRNGVDNAKRCGDNVNLTNSYPLCLPYDRLKKMTKTELEELVKEKDKIKSKQLPIKKMTGKGDIKPYKLYPSTVKNKKWDMYYEKDDKLKKVSFGNPDYPDFTQHKDKDRRERYLARATKIKGDWKSNPFSPNNLSIHLTWGQSTDINKNLKDYLKEIGIK